MYNNFLKETLKKQMIKPLLLIFVLFGVVTSQGCSGFNALDLIQSGIYYVNAGKHAFVINSYGGNPVRSY